MLTIDHIIFGAPDLEWGRDLIEEQLGVRPVIGGQHPGLGTHNALLAIGKDCYLEVIAPDPLQSSHISTPLWMGLDQVTRPRLIWWAARTGDLPQRVQAAKEQGIDLGAIKTGSRRTPDGRTLRWQLTDPGPVPAAGLLPFFIDWGTTPHPANALPSGGKLISFSATHPTPERIQATLRHLDIDLKVTLEERARLIARISTQKGEVVLR